MSVVVELGDLARRLAEYGRGYLLTSRDGRVKVVSARASAAGDLLRVPAPGPGSLANVGGNAQVTLLFPPLDDSGMTLLIDGTATVAGDDVVVTPTGAVLHKPVR